MFLHNVTEYTLHVYKEKNEKPVYLKICILNLVSHLNIFEKPKINLYSHRMKKFSL